MALNEAEFQAFKALIDDRNGHHELECRNYLKHAVGLLLPQTTKEFATIFEDRNFFGSTDYVVAASMISYQNTDVREAYIWELKAPQCYLFEKDNNNRCRPSDDFLKAENQVLHYTHEALGNSRFRARMGIVDHENIKVGGIIIGTQERLLRNSTGTMDNQNARMALKIRETYLYPSIGLRVFTWDRILSYVQPASFLEGSD